jgi:hypothetical protein
MTRRSYIQINGVLYDKAEFAYAGDCEPVAPEVMPDIEPYQSMIDGSMITSRSRHREHLKDHGMQEVGNDSSLTRGPQPMKSTNVEQLREILRAQVNDMTDRQWKAAWQKDWNNFIWNNRQD